MKLLIPIISVKISKLISMVLLASILAISFSLVTSPNAFASHVWESTVAIFTYQNPDLQSTSEVIEPCYDIYPDVYEGCE
jgi:hypothetical protein